MALGAAPVVSMARGSGGSGGVDVGRRRRRSGATVGWVEVFGGEVVAGGNDFLVKSNLAVARFAKSAIAKVAIRSEEHTSELQSQN